MGSTEAGEAQFRSALLQAWIQTRMEKDKTVTAISSLAIGWMIVSAESFVHDRCSFYLYNTALVLFLTAVLAGCAVFARNATYLERIHRIPREAEETEDSGLAVLDVVLTASFVLGMVLVAAMGLVGAAQLAAN